MKKYTICISAAALLLCLSGCRKINDALPVYDNMPSLTALTTAAETEEITESTSAETGLRENDGTETNLQANITETTEESTDIRKAGGEPENAVKKEATDTAGEKDVESISLTFYSVSMKVGESKMPIVSMSPADAGDKSEIWKSSDTAVADVDKLGNIKAISEGSCTVRVTSAQNPNVFAEVEVTVTAAPELTYFQGILVVNKTYALPADYSPGVQPEAQAAFDEMQSAAAEEGLTIYISSGFRSYDYQAGLYKRYVERSGQAEADRYSARAGHSEHQTGLAFDLNTITDEFKDTAEGKWVAANCQKYGFIIRYPADKESVTGYMYEPWHIRYLGKETAQAVYDSGLCLEEYLGITSEYSE